MKKPKDKSGEDVQDFGGMPASTTINAADIQQKEFGVSRFGGYRMRDVDEFLDRVTESMTKLADENQRLRSATGLPAAVISPAIGAPDLADTSRQADEIIARARAEAAKIVQDARGAAVSVGESSADPSTDVGRAAVAAFLAQERDFLQNLATLVQGHAESVKGMAKASRASKSSAAPLPSTAPVSTPGPSKPVRDESSSGPATQPMQAIRPTTPPKSSTETPKATPTPVPDAEAPTTIRVDEPATASVGTGDTDEDAGKGEGGDRTLRELFWGEE
jgi:DivIVA domain-containing protein